MPKHPLDIPNPMILLLLLSISYIDQQSTRIDDSIVNLMVEMREDFCSRIEHYQ